MAGSTTETVLLLLLSLTVALLAVAQDSSPSLDNSTGTLSITGTVNLDVRGVSCGEGSGGVPGPKGTAGEAGPPGLPGETGETGLKGDIGPVGIKGMTGQTGETGQRGRRGSKGPVGPIGKPGLPGPQGIQGEPGNAAVLDEKELADRVREMIDEAVNASVSEMIASMKCNCCNKTEGKEEPAATQAPETTAAPETQNIPQNLTLCDITSTGWTRVAYLDTTQAKGQACPPALRTFTNNATQQTACGTQHTISAGSTPLSMKFPANKTYTHVCGRVRGYIYRRTAAFFHSVISDQKTVDLIYADGVSITKGHPRQHLWTYAAGYSETNGPMLAACPCAHTNYDDSLLPAFVGDSYYCESAFTGEPKSYINWDDPLWDGKNCITPTNTCCQRFGWFHREVTLTDDDIEVRWMKVSASEYSEVMTDQLEIWVM